MGLLDFLVKNKSPVVKAPTTYTRQSLQAVYKSVFPNGDPTFFTPSYVNGNNKDSLEGVKFPYKNNAWVYAAVSSIATNIITLEKVLDEKNTDEADVITDHPALKVLENPNPLMDGPTFWENVILDLMLPTKKTNGGQCFIVAESGTSTPVNLTRGEIPRELYPFSDEFFKPILEKKSNQLLGWKYCYSDDESKTILYKPEELIRIFLVDPSNPLLGQSPITSANRSLRQDLKSSALNENFFDNNASLGGTLQTDAELDADVAKELRSSFEEAYKGQENAGRIALLHSGVKYEMFQQSHQDMQFMDQKKWTREEILAVYGVPKFAVSLYEDINFATATAAQKTYWNQTLLPIDQRLLRAFNNQWIRFFPGNLELESNLAKVQALQPDLTLKLEQGKQLWSMGVPLKEINRRLELQLELDDIPWAATQFVNFNLVPAERIMTGELDELNDDDESQTNSPAPEDADKVIQNAIDGVLSVYKNLEIDESHLELYIEKVVSPAEKKYKKILSEYLRTQRNFILDNIDRWSGNNKAVEKAKTPDPDDFLPGKKKEDKRLVESTKGEYAKQIKAETELVTIELGSLINWSTTDPAITEMLKERFKQLKGINSTSFKLVGGKMKKVLAQSIEEKWGQVRTAKELKKAVGKTYGERINTKTIARTEINSIHSQTRANIYAKEGIKEVRWITAADENVRGAKAPVQYSHKMLHNLKSSMKIGFNNGQTIYYPHDPKASSANTINCRCQLRAVIPNK